ncbi:MAG: low-specificity L-threonine aldolase [Candidatus Bathyarchaeota archaeon]|nr:low-specificity L-threonine aldolase [Candidatus Bathyarchaeota archaeon]
MEKNLDFRSDTVTFPTPEMRTAIAEAKLGDDVYGEDPTVNELERLAADMLGKEAGLFVTSGTQGNAVSVLAQTNRGDEILLEANSHIYLNEVGGLAVIGSLMPKPIPGDLGWIKPEDIRGALRPKNIHYPESTLLCIENTHNTSGGIPLTVEQLKVDWDVAQELGLAVHLDGARIFNAAVALNVDVKDLSQYADTVQLCLSKGLAAPVGSVVVGTHDTITKARKYRKMLGGGMRQAGIIAAPGVIALTQMVNRLAEDHVNAGLLADGLQKLGIQVLNPVRTNMVYIDFADLGWTGTDWVAACKQLGWKTRARGSGTRLCLHYGIESDDIHTFLDGLTRILTA